MNSFRLGTCLASVLLLAHCSHNLESTPCPGSAGCIATGGRAESKGGSTSTGGMAAAAGGNPSNGGAAAVSGGAPGGAGTSGSTSTAGVTAQGGALATGGSAALGGTTPTAGTSSLGGAATGGAGTTTGGAVTSGTGGSSGAPSAGAPSAGASSGGSGGATSAGAPSGGSGGVAGGSSGPEVDQKGVPLAKAGDSKTASREYLNLGDFRLLVNKWGSDELRCNTSMKVFVNNDKSFGWSFDRGACGGDKAKPDYPEIEFGIHPFGASSSLATTPSFSSTKLLPLQIKDIMTANVVIDGLNASIQKSTTYNVNFEFWLSQKNPVTEASPGVHAELITFWAWNDTWACDQTGSVAAGAKTYNLCHQSDSWGSGWRYFQFRASGQSQSFSGKVDVKALLDYLVNNRSYSKDLWVTRFEVGSEIDDNTAGTVTLKNITVEVNGKSTSARFAQ
jgi:hypothetical protein